MSLTRLSFLQYFFIPSVKRVPLGIHECQKEFFLQKGSK
jgi:hypothetical protein